MNKCSDYSEFPKTSLQNFWSIENRLSATYRQIHKVPNRECIVSTDLLLMTDRFS